MNITKSLLVAGTVATVGVGTLGVSVASAMSEEFQPARLADKLTGKVAADEGEAKGAHRVALDEHKAQLQQSLEVRLDELVREGKLTEEQKSKILAKRAELQAQMEAELKMNLSDKTKEQMHAVAEERRTALEVWGQTNGIPAEYVYLALGIPHAKAPGMMVAPSSGTTSIQGSVNQ